jgi:vitamin B12 transporter
VLVLVDGVPLTRQDATGSVGIENIMLDQVERIEIVRGNVSAIYGSSAIGGVIQIFTKAATGKPRAFAKVELGSLASARASAGISGSFGSTQYTLGVGQQKTDGFSSMNAQQYPLENPDADGYKNSNYNLGLTQEIAKGHRLGFKAQGSDGEFDFDGGGFGTSQDIYKGRTTLQTWQLFSHNQINTTWGSKLSYSESRDRILSDARQAPSYSYLSDAVTQTKTTNWTNTFALQDWLLTAGLEHQNQAIETFNESGPIFDSNRNLLAVFAGLFGTLGAHSLQLNARQDRVRDAESNNTGYLGYGYQLNPAWKLLASTSTAFNLPPLGYLFDPESGNPNLKPETARSSELGVQWAQRDQILRLNYFDTRTSNLLLYVYPTFTNVGSATNKGLELSYSGTFSGVNLRASLTSQNAMNETTNKRLERSPENMASFGIYVPWNQWNLGAELRYTGSRPDRTRTLDAYSVLDLKVRYAIARGLDLTARIDNALDADYQTAYGYNQGRRAGYVGLSWTQQ